MLALIEWRSSNPTRQLAWRQVVVGATVGANKAGVGKPRRLGRFEHRCETQIVGAMAIHPARWGNAWNFTASSSFQPTDTAYR